jgi:hypothetical protein
VGSGTAEAGQPAEDRLRVIAVDQLC